MPGEAEDSEAQATAAEISIRVRGQCVTEVEDRRAKTVRTCIRASATLLATWLLSNWWRLRWEPYKESGEVQALDWEMSHSVPSIGRGYAWPPLTFASDGRNILVRCQGLQQNDSELLSPIRYLNSFAESIDARAFEEGVRSFVQCVIERLNAIKVRDTVLHELWTETESEQQHTKQAANRKLEALLGLDPDENEALIKDLVHEWQARVGRTALEEIAAASRTDDVQRVLDAAAKVERSVTTFADFSDSSAVRSRSSLSNAVGMQPWQLGKLAAYQLRDLWGVGSRPIQTKDIAERLRITSRTLDEDHSLAPFSFGVKGRTEDKLGFILKRRHEHSRRFDVARLIGDHLFQETGDKWMPATRSFTARQRFQRAFAAEFLCPSDELRHRYAESISLDDVDDITQAISAEFNVSPKVALNHLVNLGRVPHWLVETDWDFIEPYVHPRSGTVNGHS